MISLYLAPGSFGDSFLWHSVKHVDKVVLKFCLISFITRYLGFQILKRNVS